VPFACEGGAVLEDRLLEDGYCATCLADTLFERPPCIDGHEDDCPDWACTACGTAVATSPVPALIAVAENAVAA
jgi:hypothetical protein